jgi:hypothetical protein
MNTSLRLFVVAFLLLTITAAHASAAIVTFAYSGTGGSSTQTTAEGSFTFADPTAFSLTLSDLISFTLHQTVAAGNGAVIGFFDFTKSDLVSFAVSISNSEVVGAAFETQFKAQTSSPTGTDFKPQRFVDLSVTEAKTEFQDLGGFISTDTVGTIVFSNVPEPSSVLLVLFSGFLIMISRRRPNQSMQQMSFRVTAAACAPAAPLEAIADAGR